jgi:hypothetical protein
MFRSSTPVKRASPRRLDLADKWAGYLSQEDILQNANALFRAEQSQDLRPLIADKIEDLRHYDVQKMERVVAITFWGRSGSILLASHLDGHDDVLMLPGTRSDEVYKFLEFYPSLSLRQKLLAYPAFTNLYDKASVGAGVGGSFFDGPFAVSPAEYYAAVQAICEVYGNWPPEFLKSRRAFLLFVHIAHHMSLGRRPASSSPLIVCALHWWNNARARDFVADFPQAKFLHTVRDPITSFDRFFDWLFDAELLLPLEPLPGNRAPLARETQPGRYISDVAAWKVVRAHIVADRPYSGMESRTRAIRFEDLHRDTAQTMRDLADWLGLPYRTSLLDSTFNGTPYVVTRDGSTWSGPRPQKAQRSSQHISSMDRALLFALFHENFLAWNYPCPAIFGQPIIRCLVLFLFPLLPMKMEVIVARAVLKRRVLPSLRHGNIAIATKSLLRMLLSRLAIFGFLVREASRRLAYRKALLQINCALSPRVDCEPAIAKKIVQ